MQWAVTMRRASSCAAPTVLRLPIQTGHTFSSARKQSSAANLNPASLLFPLLLVPRVGLVKTAVITGVVNALVALSATFILRIERRALVRSAGAVVLGALAFAFVRAEDWVRAATD
jgi:predicted membrane-bound spermidine synthase